MRVLVTGSSGLVGEAVCSRLESRGDEVVRFDHRRSAARTGPAEFTPVDVLRPADLARASRGVDGVIHLAAVSRCAPAEADPGHAHAVNVDGTANVLRALEEIGNPAWFVFASSREVYGEAQTIPVPESAPVQPKSVYGHTKARAEDVIRTEERRTHRPSTLLRFTNLYGGLNDHPERVIPSFLTRALRGEPLEVRGPDQVLDFLEVRDAVSAILRAAGSDRTGESQPNVFNIASGAGCSLGELARLAVRVTGSRSEIRETRPEAWTPSRFVGDVRRARVVLGWEPSVPLSEGLRTLANAYGQDASAASPSSGGGR